MRKIKVRILSKQSPDDSVYDTWEYFELPQDLGMDDEIYCNKENYKLETMGQFTGLLDKNGKEIYEGDVVEYGQMTYDWGPGTDYSVRLREEVEWEENGYWPLDETFDGVHNTHDFNPQDFEVIGNIYENTNLIK